MNTSILKTLGRWVYGVPFLIFGILHFINAGQMSGFVPGWIPGGAFWVYLTGLAMILAAISILIGKMTRLAGQLLALLLLIFVLTIHLPSVIGGGAPTNLLKDLVMAGGALLAAAYLDNEAGEEDSEESSSE